MNELQLDDHCCPVFIFDPAQRQGRIINPATGLIELNFPAQQSGQASFLLHNDSYLSPDFASYLYYLVHEHILFTRLAPEGLVCIDAGESESDTETEDPGPGRVFDYASIWFRAPLHFDGLPDIYDRFGFGFIDGALHSPLYCDVIEPAPSESGAMRRSFYSS